MKELLKKQSVRKSLSLAALAMLGCLAALNLRSGAGVWVSLPLYPVCVAAAAFLKVKFWHRVTFFPLLTSIVCLSESDSPKQVLPYLGMSLLCLCLVTGGVCLLRKKQLKKRLIGSCLAAAYLVSAFFVLGNPFVALSKGNELNDYIAAHYGEGSHFAQVRFDTYSGNYTVTAYNKKYPTETAEIFLMGDRIVDHYKDLAEQQATREQAMKITEVLRKAFPDDTFTVTGVKVDGYHAGQQKYNAASPDVSAKNMHFRVEIGAETSAERYRDKVDWYRKVLDANGIEYASITYLGGTKFHYRTAISVKPSVGIFSIPEKISVYVRRHPDHFGFLEDVEPPILYP